MSFISRSARILVLPFHRLYTHRETIVAFVRRDIRGRYITSVMGFSWAVIQPIVLLLLYTFIFSYILKIRLGADGSTASFSAYLFCGLLPWFAFSEGVIRSASVIIENTNLIKKVVFPAEILPAYVVVSAIVTELIGLAIFIVAVALFFVGLSWHCLFLVFVIFIQFLFTMGLSWIVSSLNVFLRDVGQALGLVMTTWMFLTPIFYPSEMIPERFKLILFLNPLYYVVQSYRDLLLNQTVPTLSFAIVPTLMAVVTFVVGHYFFNRSKKAFVDVI